MEPRRKPVPNPIARASVAPARALAPVRGRSSLPTVAALLAATASLALGCQEPLREAISSDPMTGEVLHASITTPGPSTPRTHGPLDPLPGMGALEEPTPVPVPVPSVIVPPPPPHKPYPVKGGIRSVHPSPLPPPAAGGLKPAAPIPPPTRPPKLSGDVAAVLPETT